MRNKPVIFVKLYTSLLIAIVGLVGLWATNAVWPSLLVVLVGSYGMLETAWSA